MNQLKFKIIMKYKYKKLWNKQMNIRKLVRYGKECNKIDYSINA